MPSFFSEGNTPRIKDSLLRTTKKILGAMTDSVGSSASYAAGGNFSGSGSPEGVVPARLGATYVDTDPGGALYYKRANDGAATGWV